MSPIEYEQFVAEYFNSKGYKTELTSFSNDQGVDVIAINATERVAIQAKMYGNSSRSVNRSTITELVGSAQLADCDRAVLATNGSLLPDAILAAQKLNVEVLYLAFESTVQKQPVLRQKEPLSAMAKVNRDGEWTFTMFWNKVKLLEGRTLYNSRGLNKIVRVDDGGIARITSTGKSGKIPIEPFKWTFNKIMSTGIVTRNEINQEFPQRVSSGVVLIFREFPDRFKISENPISIQKNA